MVRASIYDKVSRESNQRTISSQASKFINSNNLQIKQNNSNLSVSVNNASAENIGTLRLSKNNSQLNNAFRLKLLSQNDLVRIANKNTALPYALSINWAQQVIDTARTISVQTA